MGKNADLFLASFNRIERWLREQVENPGNAGFSELTRRLAKNKRLGVHRVEVDLLEMAQLRNAIVHNHIAEDFVLAEPNDWAVERLQTIEKDLTEPEKVYPKFAKKVTGFEEDTPLTALLKIMAQHGHSRFPIYRQGKMLGLITAQSVGFWFAEQSLAEENVAFSGWLAGDIFKRVKPHKNYAFLAHDAFLFEARELFQNNLRIEAIFLTKDGDPNGNLTGMIRPRDIVEDGGEEK